MKKTLPNITELRFFLALIVILFHVPQFAENRGLPYFNNWPVFQKGTEAVYLFFSLSGFLIIRQLYDEKVLTKTINLKNFYTRRMLRIFPLYYLIFFIGIIYYNFILPFLGYNYVSDYPLLNGLLLGAFFVPNIFSALYQPGGILEILWSIGIEEQFYLFIAPLLLLFKNTVKSLAIFTILYCILFFSGFLPFLKAYQMLFFFFTFSGVLSIFSESIKFNKFVKAVVLTLVVLYFTTNLMRFQNDALYLIFSSLLFSIFIHSICYQPLYIIKSKILNYLGKISYGIYMYHAVIMQVVFLIMMQINYKIYPAVYIMIYTGIVICVTTITASLSYEYFEKYFIKLKHKFQ